MEENNQNTPTPPPENSPAPSAAAKKPFYKKVWFIILASVVGLFVVLTLISFILSMFSGGGGGSKSAAGELFYSMIETAAQKDKVRFAYDRTQPAVGEEPALKVKSLTEYDYANKKYSTAYASENISAHAGRCVENVEYMIPENKFPDTFADAEAALRSPAVPSTDRYPVGTCDYNSVTRYYGAFTDGILPVGFSAQQATGMAEKLKSYDAAVFKDEGTATYNGKKGRKISFEVNPEKTGRPYKADVFFYSFRDGTSKNVGGNGVDIEKINDQFSIRLRDSAGVKGYYLIDEATKLPIYSETVTLAEGGAPNFAPDTMISVYEYPETLTMKADTQLLEIGKPEK